MCLAGSNVGMCLVYAEKAAGAMDEKWHVSDEQVKISITITTGHLIRSVVAPPTYIEPGPKSSKHEDDDSRRKLTKRERVDADWSEIGGDDVVSTALLMESCLFFAV